MTPSSCTRASGWSAGADSVPRHERPDPYRLDFAAAYLVAFAETTGINAIVSFDRAIDRVRTVTRRAP